MAQISKIRESISFVQNCKLLVPYFFSTMLIPPSSPYLVTGSCMAACILPAENKRNMPNWTGWWWWDNALNQEENNGNRDGQSFVLMIGPIWFPNHSAWTIDDKKRLTWQEVKDIKILVQIVGSDRYVVSVTFQDTCLHPSLSAGPRRKSGGSFF